MRFSIERLRHCDDHIFVDSLDIVVTVLRLLSQLWRESLRYAHDRSVAARSLGKAWLLSVVVLSLVDRDHLAAFFLQAAKDAAVTTLVIVEAHGRWLVKSRVRHSSD